MLSSPFLAFMTYPACFTLTLNFAVCGCPRAGSVLSTSDTPRATPGRFASGASAGEAAGTRRLLGLPGASLHDRGIHEPQEPLCCRRGGEEGRGGSGQEGLVGCG